MKKTILMLALSCFILSGCSDHDNHSGPHGRVIHRFHRPNHGSGQDLGYSEYIPADTANIMINSYLQSINDSDSDLHCLIYNADSLRAYLSDSTVVSVKFMFAHTMDYIDSGGQGQYAGYQSGALTFVIAGYNAQGNYVFYYYPKTTCPMVKDHCEPCPMVCPNQGTAQSDTLILQPTSKR